MTASFQTEIVLIGIAALLAIVGYFLRKTNEKIDNTSVAVEKLSESFQRKINLLEEKLERESKDTHTEILKIFQEMCHERQGSCALLRDAKLERVEVMAKTACGKIEKIENERSRQWDRQEGLNEKFKEHIYKTKDKGSSWDLKEK